MTWDFLCSCPADMNRELESHRNCKSLEPKLDLGPGSLYKLTLDKLHPS